ncbi:MAG TPA: efflux transporter outer membrane subunit [Bryobacteraceae bacterium]|nr:efflux transporter outer membrane subunit [Bryobacteraceae bacterium]
MKRCGYVLPMLLLAGCAVGPNYKRPDVPVPDAYRGQAAAAPAASLADMKWPDLFRDEALKKLIADALQQNLDLALAAERVEEARAQFRITGANRYPFVYAQAQFAGSRSSLIGANTEIPPGTSLDTSYTQAGGALSWELDLWGRVRRLTESARARYLASEEARRGVVVSLIADVADTYFALRERDMELEIARSTRDIAARNLELVRVRHDHGAVTALDVHEAEQFLFIASAQIASTQREIGQTENALSLLLGRPPGDIMRGRPMDDYGLPPELPAGLPSSLLDRRPDIREAEQRLIAANAQIGVAKAYYFPQISLTGFLGGQSRALMDLFTGPARDWIIAPTATLPIFNAGQVRVAVRLSEAQKREMLVAYQRAIYTAFREVSDALIGYHDTREQRRQQDQLVHALEETTRLSNLRYQGGMDSYLQVLDAERTLFQGRLSLAQLRLQELLSFVQLYRALGGGWQ